MNGLKTRRLAFYPKQGNKIEGVVLNRVYILDIHFWKQGPNYKKEDRILLRHLTSNNWKYRTKEARLILQSGMYISFMYFRNFLSQTGSGFQIPRGSPIPKYWSSISPRNSFVFYLFL